MKNKRFAAFAHLLLAGLCCEVGAQTFATRQPVIIPVARPEAPKTAPVPIPSVPRPEPVKKPPVHVPTVKPETLAVSQLNVERVRVLPQNFDDASAISWSADGTKLLVERLRRRATEIAEVEVPSDFGGIKMLKERIVSDGTQGSLSLHCGAPFSMRGAQGGFFYTKQSSGSRDYQASMPVNGWYCNLYYASPKQRQGLALTQNLFSSAKPQGAAFPVVSPDGRKIFWCGVNGRAKDKNLWGQRALYIADLIWKNGIPSLANVGLLYDETLGTFQESCAFTQDGNSILYSANKTDAPWYMTDLYVRNLKTNTVRCITNGGWNRWASYSPEGRKIIWSASRGFTNANMGAGGNRWQQELHTELWVMSPDGMDRKRLTMFNQRDSRDNLAIGMTSYEHCYVSTSAWNPNGRQIAVVVNFGARKRATSIVVLLDLDDRLQVR